MKLKTIRILLPIGLALLLTGNARAQQRDYRKDFLSLYHSVQRSFYDSTTGFYTDVDGSAPKRDYAYLWPLCGLLQASNEAEELGIREFSLVQMTGLIEKYKSYKAPAPGYDSYLVQYGGGDRFYDDNQWLGLAWMDAWFRKRSPDLLKKGELIYRFMMTGYDTATGGGLYWEEGKYASKNTCSNGPGIILALQLYKATHEKKYLDTALLLYHWVNEHLQDSDKLYFDNIRVSNRRVAKVKYSYNTGTMLQANLYLYELTKNPVYRQRANDIADRSLHYFYSTGKFRDGYWFNAVMLRAYQDLLKINPDRKYLQAFEICTDEAVLHNTSAAGIMGIEKPTALVNQAGMLEIMVRLALLEKQ